MDLISLHIKHGTVLCRHRQRQHRQLHSQQILTFCIESRQEPRPQMFLLVPLSFCLRQLWHLFVCRRHVSWQT